MNSNRDKHIVVIGNGIAGITLARHVRKRSGHRISVISSEAEYFFSRTALMYVYMGHMRWKDIEPYESWFWEKNRIDRIKAHVDRIEHQTKTLHFSDGRNMTYDILVIACGSRTATYGWEGSHLPQVLGLVSKQDLEKLERVAPNKEVCPHAVVVGGGLIGVELAEMLRSREIKVTFLVRESAFWASALPRGEAAMLSRHISGHGVDLRHQTELQSILEDGQGQVRGVLTSEGEEIPCSMVGIATGVRPNIGFLENSGIATDIGIIVNRKLETNVEGIYAIGDCAQHREPPDHRSAIEAVWYTGRMMGETLARTLCGTPTEYRPGPWFNSAKFFDIEFQTYGRVSPEKKKSDYEGQLHWKHPDDTHCITLAYHTGTGKFLGINTFGIRMRHAVLEDWLASDTQVDTVLAQLQKAWFDPEFSHSCLPEIQKTLSHQRKTAVL